MRQERTIEYEDFEKEPERKYILGYDSKEDIVLHYREEGQLYALNIKHFPWYFCVTRKDYIERRSVFKRFEDLAKIKRVEDDGEYVRIYTRNTNLKVMDEKHEVVKALDTEGILTYEADVSSHQRLLIDNGLQISDSYRVLYFDIETDDRGKGIVVGRDRILSIACMNEEGKTYYYTDEDEKKILKKFLDRIDDYDLISGWNSEKFDVPYIKERLRYHNIWYNWRQILQLDLMQKTMEIHKRNIQLIKEVRGFSLKAISTYFLGETKVEIDRGTYDLFENDPELLKKYNIQDVALLVKLDKKLNLVKQKVAEHLITGCFLNEYAVSRTLDVYVLRNAKKFGSVRFPSKPNRDEIDFSPNKESGYVGGYVIDPIRGIHEKVYHFDFTSLYPSIIQTFNISPETWLKTSDVIEDKTILTPNNQLFKADKGIIPLVISELLEARNRIRYNELKQYKEGTQEYETFYFMQYAFKTIANSFYGILGAAFTRYYKLEVAEAITLSGHYLIKLVKQWFESEGFTVIYGDTDSVFVKCGHEIDEEEYHTRINTFLEYHLTKRFGVLDSKVDLKVEAHYDTMFLQDKKRYVKNHDGELKIVGLEARRRETLPLAAKSQTEMLEMLLLHKASKEEIIDWLAKLQDKVLNHMTIEDLTLQIKLSKDVDDYARKVKNKEGLVIGYKPTKLAHAQVAIWLKENGVQENKRNTWEKGCYVKYIVTAHKPNIEAISVYQYAGDYDHSYYWDVKIYAMLQRILEVIYPEHDWNQYLLGPVKKKRESNQLTLC